MSSSNEPKGIKREFPDDDDDDDESKPTVQSGTSSSSHVHAQPIKQEQFDESESKPIHQLEATFSFAGPVKLENVQVKQEEAASPVSHVFGHMAKCTLGNQCTTPNCSSIKAMAKHWLSCASAHCSVCGPFQPQSNYPLPQFSAQSISVSQIQFPSPNISQSNFTQPIVSPPSPSQSTPTQALEQLLSTLLNSNIPEVLQQILNILKSQPALMSTFIKQRQEMQRQQHDQQHYQSSIHQSHNPLPQSFSQTIPGCQANVPNSNIAQPGISRPQVSGLQSSSTMTPTQANQQLVATLPTPDNNPQARPQFLNSLKSRSDLRDAFNVPQDLFAKLTKEPKVGTQLSVRKEVTTQCGATLNRQGHDQITQLLELRELVEENAQLEEENAQLLQEQQMLKLRLKQLKQQHKQSSINQTHNPLPQATRQTIPGSQCVNVPTLNIAQPNNSRPQVSGLQSTPTMTPTPALQQQQQQRLS